MPKIAVYSCITGDFEKPKIDQNFEGADFFLFTNTGEKFPSWKEKVCKDIYKDPRRNARYHKLLSHEFFNNYDWTIWIDGSITLNIPAFLLIEKVSKHNITVLKHPVRECAYQEALECLKKNLDYEENLHFQMSRMKKNNYPENNGLGETKIVIRKNCGDVEEFNKEWFYQLSTGTLRDQVSFNYAAWITGQTINYLPSWPEIPEIITYHRHTRKEYDQSTHNTNI